MHYAPHIYLINVHRKNIFSVYKKFERDSLDPHNRYLGKSLKSIVKISKKISLLLAVGLLDLLTDKNSQNI